MTEAVISHHPTKNAAYDSLYAEIHSPILPHNATAIPAEPLVIGKPARSTVSILAASALAIGIGALGLWYGAPAYDADPGMAIAAALHPAAAPAYSVSLDH